MKRSSEKPEHPNCSIIAPRDVSRCLSPQIGSGGKRGAFYMYGVRNECAPTVSQGAIAMTTGSAMELVQARLDGYVFAWGGYPAEIIGPMRGLIFVADVAREHDGSPVARVIDEYKLCRFYRECELKALRGEYEEVGEAFDDLFDWGAVEPDDLHDEDHKEAV